LLVWRAKAGWVHDWRLTIAAIALSRFCDLSRGKSTGFSNVEMLEDLGYRADIGLLHVVESKDCELVKRNQGK